MNPSILIVIAATVLVIISQLASAQREIPQCECSAIAPCKGAYVGAVLPCLDQCQVGDEMRGIGWGNFGNFLSSTTPLRSVPTLSR